MDQELKVLTRRLLQAALLQGELTTHHQSLPTIEIRKGDEVREVVAAAVRREVMVQEEAGAQAMMVEGVLVPPVVVVEEAL